MKIRRWIWRALQISTVVTAVANAAVLFQHPFAEPYVVRAKAKAELALDRAIRKQMTPAWVAAELDHAVKSEDLDRAALLLELVEHHRIPVAQSHTTRAREFVNQETGMWQCLACLANAAECRTPSEFLRCHLTIEMSPVGDVRTLIKAGADAETVDKIDVTLAAVGLGATVLAPLTGGSSYTIKIGATAFRVARKMGRLGKGLGRIVAKAATTPIRWNKIYEFVKTGKPSAVTDVRHLEEIGDIAGKISTVSKHANPPDAIFLLKHVNNGKDAAELASISKVAGKRTRGTVEVLGLAKAGAAIKRLSNLFMLAVGLLFALAGQLAALASPVCMHLLRRIVDPSREEDEKSPAGKEDGNVAR